MGFKTVNPCTGELVREYENHTKAETEQRIQNNFRAFSQWRKESLEVRAGLFEQLAKLLESKKSELAALITLEMGKVKGEAVSEIEKCAWVCRYYAEKASDFLEPETIETDASKSYVTYTPLGPVLAIMPWNFPFWQVFRYAAPNLMAGNAALLKHAPNVPGCALAIEELFKEAGFPEHLLCTLFVSDEATEAVIAHDLIRAVTLTGSTAAGRKVAATAGKHLKKTVLELGGSDAYLILDDADIELAATACATSRLLNAGQSCIAAKRFIVANSCFDAFADALQAEMSKKSMGAPDDASSGIGPMAREDLRTQLHQQVTESVKAGARILLGCEMPAGAGSFYPPSILSDVQPGMPAFDEELFGPVAALIRAESTEKAVELANKSSYGLGAAVFGSDVARAEKIASQLLDAGSCFVNDFVRSDPRLPFGGIKNSGYGRELGIWGMREFVNIKTVSVK
ncbi:MAG: NAD-dependent succinate-semialdehyde dehydrogenase [Balneolales bacterium]|nr:NAD-dependent succinate-semialdehyde dehydrogenase [Balneolales bacterium]